MLHTLGWTVSLKRYVPNPWYDECDLTFLLVAQLCLTFCDPMVCSLAGSSVYGILQARILEWVAVPFSRGSSWPNDWTLGVLYCRWILYCLSHQGSPIHSEWCPSKRKLHMKTQTCSVKWWQRQGVEWCNYKPGYAKDCRPLPEGRNKAGRDLPRLYKGARSPRTAVRQHR